jgi:hypothetical protein
LIQLASSMRIWICVRKVSKIAGGATKEVGPMSRRSSITVSALSGQFTVKPPRWCWATEKKWSPTQASGR